MLSSSKPTASDEKKIVIRQATDKDTPELKQIFLQTRKKHFQWFDTNTFNLEDYTKQTEGEEIWVAEKDGSVCGFIALWKETNFIHHLFVDPKYQKQGIGKELLNKATKVLSPPPYPTLKVDTANTSACLFYNKQGWTTKETNETAKPPYHLMEYQPK